jgi:uncharacterized RDD family membrane protein YckC
MTGRVAGHKPPTLWGLVVLWLCTAVIGSILALSGFLGVVDPAGSKHADDSDPFGPPGGRLYPAVLTLVGAALILWPLVPLVRTRSAATPPKQGNGRDGEH